LAAMARWMISGRSAGWSANAAALSQIAASGPVRYSSSWASRASSASLCPSRASTCRSQSARAICSADSLAASIARPASSTSAPLPGATTLRTPVVTTLAVGPYLRTSETQVCRSDIGLILSERREQVNLGVLYPRHGGAASQRASSATSPSINAWLLWCVTLTFTQFRSSWLTRTSALSSYATDNSKISQRVSRPSSTRARG
jgi:hypothetical protein